jgi:hypothetical protein
MVIFAAAFCLMGSFAASAHWPITHVGQPEMHRFDGTVRQVTLVQPHVEQAKVRVGQRLDRTERKSGPAVHPPTASEREFEIRRYGGQAQQVTLVTSADERLSELLRSSAPDAEYAIEVGKFLREPEPSEELFTNDEWFAPELERTSHRGRLAFGGVVIGH